MAVCRDLRTGEESPLGMLVWKSLENSTSWGCGPLQEDGLQCLTCGEKSWREWEWDVERNGMRQKWPDARLELEFVICFNSTLPMWSFIFYPITHTEQYERHKKKNQVQVTRQAQQYLFIIRGLTIKVRPVLVIILPSDQPHLISPKIVKSLSVCKKQKSKWITNCRNLNFHF